ncbi:MAG TPA: xanthine dehydrogenase family protein molybdopterin-binding subunit [Thermodesulfobacteriota bacterium]|nr:xanthine dehydrogenase family protein molybdopterin-binding subunit [Thermodesulfobacteriota bacterium]
MIGASLKRREDPRLLTGRGLFTDDVKLPGLCYAAVVRSPYPHARIVAVDLEPARRHPGVVAAFAGADLAGRVRPLPIVRRAPGQVAEPPAVLPLAVDRVRYQGEPVAVVMATSREAASDAAELVGVEYDPLPAVTSVEAAAAEGAPRLHDAFPGNVAFVTRLEGGDAERAFREADVVVSQRMVDHRLVACAMEPRACVVQYDPFTGKLTAWFTTQRPHHTRWFLSRLFGLPEHRVRVIAPDVGGGFGSKGPLYPDEAAVAFCAIATGRPVKWAAERREDFASTVQGRDQVAHLEVAARRDGTITAVRGTITANMGAYLYANTAAILPGRTAPMLPNAYAIAHVSLELRGIFTNTTPTGPYRGAGRPEACYYMERLVDLVARELGLDPVEVRRRNFVPPDRFPYETATGLVYDSGDYRAGLDKAVELLGYEEARRRQREARQEGRYLGIGVASYVELGGVVGSRQAAREGSAALWESAVVRVLPTGAVTVFVGTCGHGQGHETTFAQIAADLLGVPVEDVAVVYGDTEVAPMGFGTFGTRSTPVGGSALALACRKVVEKGKRIAARLLEAAVEDVEFERGRFFVRGSPQRARTIQEVAQAAILRFALPGEEPGLEAQAVFDPPNYTFGSGTHACLVEVDPETGEVTILRYVAVDDCGRLVNPLIVDGQIHGGVVQGIAQALYEYLAYDDNGQLLTSSLNEYAVPRAHQVPVFETAFIETPSPVNPLGVKGVGEAGAIVAPPAVVNAVVDALAPLGIRHLDMPLTPARVWQAVRQARAARGGGA